MTFRRKKPHRITTLTHTNMASQDMVASNMLYMTPGQSSPKVMLNMVVMADEMLSKLVIP